MTTGQARPHRSGLFATRAWLGPLVLLPVLVAGPAQAATFTVRNTNDAGNNSLRWAITNANGTAALDTIDFDINPAGAKTIALASALPAITQPVIIDGTTQPGWVTAGSYPPVIELNGAGAGAGAYGLDLQPGSSWSTIRGLCINRFSARAIRIQASSNNVIAGNFLGTDLAGTAPLGNGSGIYIGSAASATPTDNNRIGGTAAADRNIISGNTVDGIQMNGGTGGASNNVIEGNYIGVDVTGTLDRGNGSQGVAIYNSLAGPNTNNVVGGTAPGAGNVISGNGGEGVRILEAGTTGTRVQGNKIGTDVDSSPLNPLGNGGGVRLDIGTSNNTVGGTVPEAANIIAYNDDGIGTTSDGIRLTTTAGTGNAILGNAIYSNGRLGIDLRDDGVTGNDLNDGDSGPNDLLNYPDLTYAGQTGGMITVAFDLDVAGPADYRIEFFRNPGGADALAGEGEGFAGAKTITHLGGGVRSFSALFPGVTGDIITATTTRCTNGPCTTYGSTSEFSLAETVTAATAVELLSFDARGAAAGVELFWQTASELRNLGFHLHRAPSEAGPWTRITSSLFPGLGSSPIGASYSHVDAGLVAGQRYFYRLEDVDTASVSTFHGPVSAVAGVTAPPAPGDGGGGASGRGTEGEGGSEGSSESCPSWVLSADGALDATSLTCTKHGDPDSASFEVVSRDSRGAVLELRTGGFWAVHTADPSAPAGTAPRDDGVRVYVKGLDTPSEAEALALPLRRALVEAVVGKRVRLVSAEGFDLQTFGGLRPSAVGASEMGVSRDGTVRAVRRAVGTPRVSGGYAPERVARLVGTVFQGERKSAVVEVTPLRLDGASGELVLAGRVRVRLEFAGLEPGETGTGSTGRRGSWRTEVHREVLAQLYTTRRGLHGVRFEEVFPGRRRGCATSLLRLQREGEAVAFHVEPRGEAFAPGSVLYFHAERTAQSTEFTGEVAYELVRSREGERGEAMEVVASFPVGPVLVASSTGQARLETNRIYQPGLLEAEDVWLWEALASGASRTKEFSLTGVDKASLEGGRVVVYLQGGSASGTAEDHHVRVEVNGSVVGETRFAGAVPHRVELAVPTSVLLEGSNEVTVVNVGDTGVSSLVFLDRFTVGYAQRSEAQGGVFEGEWAEGGQAEVLGFAGRAVVVDVTDPASGVKWLSGFEALAGGVRFGAQAGHLYLAVSAAEGLLAPRVARKAPSTLRSAENQADYLLIAPESFLAAAEPLLLRRASQGLEVKGVSLEEIATVFGYGRASGEAIRRFVSHAYHAWSKPSPRYVVLLGDATYDPQHFVATSWASPLPALWGKTSYLWTATDPLLGAVNGEDALPDVAVGRIPATTVEQAESLVGKILAWEDSGQGLAGKAALVADNKDAAGDFEADVADLRASFLGDRETTVLKVAELGAGTRAAIQEAFDAGLGLLSYVGHGGSAVWASENVWNSWDAPSLLPQSRQPLLLTMNCLNGYFVGTNFDSLSESLLKVEGRGAVAVFSPSGLSVNGPAHQYQRALLAEITRGNHVRLGDAILAAQTAYAETGLMPELLSVYHLFGDPALAIR